MINKKNNKVYNMKLNGIALLLGVLLSTNAFAGAGCFTQQEGQSDESAQQTEQGYEESSTSAADLMAGTICLIKLPLTMAPGDIVSEECDDGQTSCEKTLKKFCKIDKEPPFVKGMGGIGTAACLPFKAFL